MENDNNKKVPIGPMALVSLPSWMVDFFMVNVGKYTSPMDPMGYITPKVQHGTWKSEFPKGISFCIGWFSGPMLNFRALMKYKKIYIQLPEKVCWPWNHDASSFPSYMLPFVRLVCTISTMTIFPWDVGAQKSVQLWCGDALHRPVDSNL